MIAKVKVVENGLQALDVVKDMHMEGHKSEHIYVLAHDKHRTDTIAEALHVNEVGMAEEGMFNAVANLFRSRGNELRSKMIALGFTVSEAVDYEEELDRGHILVVALRTNPQSSYMQMS